MPNLPPVKLETHISWFNLLMAVLESQETLNPFDEYQHMAQSLAQQFMAYGRRFTDADGKPCVSLRMYPKEAKQLIMLLLMELCGKEHSQDYSAALRELDG